MVTRDGNLSRASTGLYCPFTREISLPGCPRWKFSCACQQSPHLVPDQVASLILQLFWPFCELLNILSIKFFLLHPARVGFYFQPQSALSKNKEIYWTLRPLAYYFLDGPLNLQLTYISQEPKVTGEIELGSLYWIDCFHFNTRLQVVIGVPFNKPEVKQSNKRRTFLSYYTPGLSLKLSWNQEQFSPNPLDLPQVSQHQGKIQVFSTL